MRMGRPDALCARTCVAGSARVSPIAFRKVRVFTSLVSNRGLMRRRASAHHRLVFEEFFNADLAPFAADTGQLVAAVGAALVQRRAVDAHAPNAQLGRNGPRAI